MKIALVRSTPESLVKTASSDVLHDQCTMKIEEDLCGQEVSEGQDGR